MFVWSSIRFGFSEYNHRVQDFFPVTFRYFVAQQLLASLPQVQHCTETINSQCNPLKKLKNSQAEQQRHNPKKHKGKYKRNHQSEQQTSKQTAQTCNHSTSTYQNRNTMQFQRSFNDFSLLHTSNESLKFKLLVTIPSCCCATWLCEQLSSYKVVQTLQDSKVWQHYNNGYNRINLELAPATWELDYASCFLSYCQRSLLVSTKLYTETLHDEWFN